MPTLTHGVRFAADSFEQRVERCRHVPRCTSSAARNSRSPDIPCRTQCAPGRAASATFVSADPRWPAAGVRRCAATRKRTQAGAPDRPATISCASAPTFRPRRDMQARCRPPQISWRIWAMNSTSRMPPGPSLISVRIATRSRSPSIRAFMTRSAWIAPKSRYLRKTNGRSDSINRCPASRSPAQGRARIHAYRSQSVRVLVPARSHRSAARVRRCRRKDAVACDAKDEAISRDRIEHLNQPLRQLEEKLLIRRLRHDSCPAPDTQNEIDVGGQIEFAGAELPSATTTSRCGAPLSAPIGSPASAIADSYIHARAPSMN